MRRTLTLKPNLVFLPQIQAEKAAAEKAAKEKAEKEKQQQTLGEKVTRGAMTLSSSGTAINWNYTGRAVHGYKVVYSKTNTAPTFGTDNAIYFDKIGTVSTTLTKKDVGGMGKFYVRVCAYTANTENEPCVDYSNIVVVTIN